MIAWPFLKRANATSILKPDAPEPTLTRFDTFKPAEIAALPKRLRREIIADRKRRVTAALRRVAAGKARAWE